MGVDGRFPANWGGVSGSSRAEQLQLDGVLPTAVVAQPEVPCSGRSSFVFLLGLSKIEQDIGEVCSSEKRSGAASHGRRGEEPVAVL